MTPDQKDDAAVYVDAFVFYTFAALGVLATVLMLIGVIP